MRVFWTNVGLGLLLMAVFLSGLVMVSPARGDTVWESGVEAGWPAGASWNGLWTVQASSLSANTGSRGVNIVGPSASGGDAFWLDLPSYGYQTLTWEYYFKIRDGLEVGDQVTAEWTSDGQTWLSLATYTETAAGDWQLASFVLPATANDNGDLKFRFLAKLGGSTDRMNFDDFKLSGALTPEPVTAVFLGVILLLKRRRQGLP
jgi:hypothetical protein